MTLTPPADRVEQRFTIACSYPVVFTRDAFAPSNDALAWAIGRGRDGRRHRALAIVDDGVARAWPQLLAQLDAYAAAHADVFAWSGAHMVVPGGEAAKQDAELLAKLLARMRDDHLDRHELVVAIGGGAMLDVVGYAAATVHRGLRLVRMPSTVLAQNDAGIGVKNGINAFGVKNFLGTFAVPWAVVDDLTLLESLSPRDRTAGIAEAIKVAAIRDKTFFDWLVQHAVGLARGERDAVETMVRRCAELHLAHIRESGDPFESGTARPLDFGHWAAHALESLTDGALRHGEAVAIGIALDTRYAVATGRLAPAAGAAVHALIGAVGLPRWHAALAQHDASGRRAVLTGLDEFREHLGGELTVTLLAELGRGVEVHEMDESQIVAAIDWLAQQEA